jgi:hypothetical protein
MKLSLLSFAMFVVVGCSGHWGDGSDSGTPPPGDDAQVSFGDAALADSTDNDGGSCNPPDMLIVLDRSDSMAQPPSQGSQSKWDLAKSAVDAITLPPIDTTLRFGLALLPETLDGGGSSSGGGGNGGFCGSATAAIPLALDQGNAIASTLTTTQLELGTPIGGAMQVAQSTLASAKTPDRSQYVILVTDGGETCQTNGALPVVQAMAAAGVDTYVVGFGGAVDAKLLDDLACAGMTAKNFSTSCTKNGAGWVSSVPSTTHVYWDAADGPALHAALATIANGVCCGCNIPVN